ncbi:HipA domain-containing protein [Vibrio rumoiensis]|uniref:HipA domain-containing protein n=1 Tax=Vibrio rumoiensis TaxID=76258 RepID=UPI003AA8083B
MPDNTYPIIDISDQDINDYEQMGTKSKFWYIDSATGEEYLFKSIHTEDKHGKPIERKGEDWAEKVACEIAETLNIPHAYYDLANYNGQRGIRSKKFTQPGDNMFFGNQLIERVVNTLNTPLESGQRSQKVERVNLILERIIEKPPIGWSTSEHIKTALDFFIGYLMLDCLISNQDRHNENWGMIVRNDKISLAPSFDHAASLGRNESIESIIKRLQTKDEGRKIPSYVSRCKSHFYNSSKRLKTLEIFLIMGHFSKHATIEWLERLESLTIDQVAHIVNCIPDSIISKYERIFCASIIIANKARILQYKSLVLENIKKEEQDNNQ